MSKAKAAKAPPVIKGHRHGRVPRAFREEQLLDVAQLVFARKGYQGTAMEDIATAARVTRPMVYNYFRSKDGIYLACLRRARERLAAEMLAAVREARTPADRLRCGIDAYLRFMENSDPSWDLLFGGGVAVAGPAATEAKKLRFGTVDLIAGMLRSDTKASRSDQEITVIAHAVSGGGEQIAKWWRDHPGVPRETIVQYFFSALWNGLQSIAKA